VHLSRQSFHSPTRIRCAPRPHGRCAALALFAVAILVSAGCRSASNARDWSPDHAVLPSADLNGNLVRLHNVRSTEYRSADDYAVRHYDKTVELSRLDSLNFFVVPFPDVPAAAHTFLSFGFDGRDFVAISVEARRERGERFSLAHSVVRPYEIMYVVGDERDFVELRAVCRREDVYMYRMTLPPAQMQALFVDMLERANQLQRQPEHYHLVTNNCMTNIVAHVNHVAPDAIPYSHRVLLTAYSDQLLYDLKLIAGDGSFEQTKERARIGELALAHRGSPDFSAQIRGANAAVSVARLPATVR
jgi:hypothetical protein